MVIFHLWVNMEALNLNCYKVLYNTVPGRITCKEKGMVFVTHNVDGNMTEESMFMFCGLSKNDFSDSINKLLEKGFMTKRQMVPSVYNSNPGPNDCYYTLTEKGELEISPFLEYIEEKRIRYISTHKIYKNKSGRLVKPEIDFISIKNNYGMDLIEEYYGMLSSNKLLYNQKDRMKSILSFLSSNLDTNYTFLLEKTSIPEQTIKRLLKDLEDNKYISKRKEGRLRIYNITTTGIEKLGLLEIKINMVKTHKFYNLINFKNPNAGIIIKKVDPKEKEMEEWHRQNLLDSIITRGTATEQIAHTIKHVPELAIANGWIDKDYIDPEFKLKLESEKKKRALIKEIYNITGIECIGLSRLSLECIQRLRIDLKSDIDIELKKVVEIFNNKSNTKEVKEEQLLMIKCLENNVESIKNGRS